MIIINNIAILFSFIEYFSFLSYSSSVIIKDKNIFANIIITFPLIAIDLNTF